MMTDDWLYLSQVEGWQAGKKTNAIRLRVSGGNLGTEDDHVERRD